MVKILVVDDDQDILDFVSACLSDSHEVTTATDGERGLYACDHTEFDIILTDIFMPFRDGLDITREAIKRYPNIKVIAMTSYHGKGHTDYLKAAEAYGARAQLRKPFGVDELRALIDQVLGA